MKIIEIQARKKDYLDLLLFGNKQENMVERYLDAGTMFVLDDDGVKCVCVVTDAGDGVLEIKNIATVPAYQRRGYARAMIEFIVDQLPGRIRDSAGGNGEHPGNGSILSAVRVHAFSCCCRVFPAKLRSDFRSRCEACRYGVFPSVSGCSQPRLF